MELQKNKQKTRGEMRGVVGFYAMQVKSLS
jgi:hypothetical protein